MDFVVTTLRRGLLASLLLASPALAQTTGTITGRLFEKDGKTPVSWASIMLLGAGRGTQTGEDGSFRLAAVPVGTYQLKAQVLGYAPVIRTVQVDAERTTEVRLQLAGEQRPVKEVPPMEVVARRDLTTSRSEYRVDAEAIKNTPVDGVLELAGLKPGMVVLNGAIHARGTREDGTKVRLDGVEISDPLGGRVGAVAPLSVAHANVITGGISAEYSDVIGGVIDIETREGTDHFAGEVQWHTDRYGESVKTFDNYDRFTFGFGGTTPVKSLTYYGTYEGTWSDTYLKSARSRTRHDVFDFLHLGNRQNNDVLTDFKLAYTRRHAKLTLEAVNNRSERTPYLHQWSRNGFVSVAYDTVENEGRDAAVPKYGRWSFFAEDSSYQPYNAADHTPTTESKFQQLKAVWRHNLGDHDFYTVRLARNVFHDHESVQGKAPWEYEIRTPFYWSGNENDNSFFVTHGDYPRWADRRTVAYYGKADFTSNRWKGHLIKAGIEGRYDDFRNLVLLFPNQESRGLPGILRSDFQNYNYEASGFVQDRWDFEGLILNAGVHYDLFTPGSQISDADLRDPQTGRPASRYRQQLSPRLGVAYPITDRDVLSFHYGWLYQMPTRNFLFENRGSQATVAIRGNPTLQPQTNIEYQAAVQHLFSQELSGQFAVFFRDIFGQINTRQVRDELTNLLVPVFVNEDYASSRGFEASLSKGFSHGFSGEINYTYQLATGVASDPNQGLQFANGALLYLPISEQPLDWDQRHTLSARLSLRDPKRWGVNLLWTYGSGLPYTPAFRNDRKPDPRLENSRRLPSTSTLSIVADKFFRVWSRRVTLFADARNILDAKNINRLSFDTFPNPFVNQVGNDYEIYYTETGRAGGAYLMDTNGDGVDDWVPVKDPRVWQEGRSVRVGIGVEI